MKTLIRNGHVIDPSQQIDAVCDVLIESGRIAEIRPPAKGKDATAADDRTRVIEAQGMFVIPGLVDLHVHLREPGFEYKETIQTGTLAAVRGGVTSVCCMPNTLPVNDEPGITEFILKKARDEGSCAVFPVGAITKGQKGEELAEFTLLREAGCVAFSDDGRPVIDSLIMRRALEYAKGLDVPIISHSEDASLSAGGVMNEGLLAITLGLKGIPAQAEEIMVSRDIALAELTGGKLHLAHLSTAGSVALVRAAKKRGIAKITAETCPHYFTTTEEAVAGYNANAKVNPPLRTKKDIEAIRKGLHDGTIDVIATDHAPHHPDEKMGEFDYAPSGISGLETSLALSLRLVEDKVLTLSQLIEKMALNPARIIGIAKGTMMPGEDADVAIVDPKTEFTVNTADFASKGKNTPFEGMSLKGSVICTIVKGKAHEWA